MNRVLTRRIVLGGGGSSLANGALAVRPRAATLPEIIEIQMKSDPGGGVVGFDPVGIALRPGQTVRWVCEANVHTTAAYSPQNENHSLRIPEDAQPWASNFLLPGQAFEVKLTVEGVYDYFCAPHEEAGMVGRLIVGRAVGPGTLPFDSPVPEGRHWKPVPAAAQKALPGIEEILERRIVRSPLKFLA